MKVQRNIGILFFNLRILSLNLIIMTFFEEFWFHKILTQMYEKKLMQKKKIVLTFIPGKKSEFGILILDFDYTDFCLRM